MILCGTDLSMASEPAVKAAAALSKKLGRELLLATVIEHGDAHARGNAELRIEQDAGELRRDFGITVETCVVLGVPEERLLELAKARAATLIVVSATGDSHRARRLTSVPEHLCQVASIPVLVARNADGLVEWSRGARALRLLLGSGMGDASTSALDYAVTWPEASLTLAHVAWPYGEHYRLGLSGPMPMDHLRPEVHHQLMSDLGRWSALVPHRTSPKLEVVPGWGRIDAHLAQLAQEHESDVLIVGSHQRNVAARLWHGSVSRGAIHEASCNVLCVPQQHAAARISRSPRTVVVPTDFSPASDRAIGAGYALLDRGSTLHLVHVASHASEAERAKLTAQLGSRVPFDAVSRGIATELHVLEGDTPWRAIWQHAGRASADLICMATRSRNSVGSFLLGSQAQALLEKSRLPVLLVPPDHES
jgi:nucleotide-binding universal stress UspA family protein